MSKMRIWGGARFSMMSNYGDSLHPFMDWHLLNPLIGWDFSQPDKTNLQKSLIEHFKPGAMKFPINPTSTPKDLANPSLGQKVLYRAKLLFRNEPLLSPLSSMEKDINVHANCKSLKTSLYKQHRFNFRSFRKMGNPNYLTRYASMFIIKNILSQ